MLLSAYDLDAKRYNEEREEVTWETCTLRKWLNEEFINTAFGAEEQQRIITTKVENTDDPNFKTPGGNDTEDKVFLLSIVEAEKYMPTDFERKTAPTPFAKKEGACTNNGSCWWWLRSPGRNPFNAAYVHYFGNIIDRGIDVNRGNGVSIDYGAVCPALWFELGSGIE